MANQTVTAPQLEKHIDAGEAFRIASDCIRKHSPEFWGPPFAIRYHEHPAQWIISTRTDVRFGNAEIIIDTCDGRVIQVAWSPVS
jgi:hypothetical protein